MTALAAHEYAPVIKAEGLVKTYQKGKVVAVEGIDVTVMPGEWVNLMGPSGSGKSTLLYLLGTLEQPDSGSITIAGQDVDKIGSGQLAKLRRYTLGFIFQQFHLLPALTALENVMLPLFPYEKKVILRARAIELLNTVGLAHRLDHLPSQLSGGEQQRVAIARALIGQPTILLADEPTGNLDSRSGQQVIELLEQIVKERQVSLVMATHNQEFESMSDRLLRMSDGRFVNDD